MEVALFLGLWALSVVAWDDLRTGEITGPRYTAAGALGAAGFLMCATRPEGIGALGVLVVVALWDFRRQKPLQLAGMAALALGPAFLVLVGHGIANRLLTGDSTAAG